MNNLFNWIDAHQVLSALVLLALIIATGEWLSHRQVITARLQGLLKTVGFQSPNDEYTVATVEAGKRYLITIAAEKTSFLVRSINERFAVFEVLVSAANPANTQGRDAHGWAFKINHSSIRTPELYASAFAAGRAMEQHFSVGRRPVHA